jgi:hypothetical protein
MIMDPALWLEAKQLARTVTGWPMDTLHVIAGVLLQIGLAALLRTSLADLRPWLLLFLLEMTNEAYDLWVERWPSLGMQVGEGLRDLAATMLIPTILLWVARRRPRLLTSRR